MFGCQEKQTALELLAAKHAEKLIAMEAQWNAKLLAASKMQKSKGYPVKKVGNVRSNITML